MSDSLNQFQTMISDVNRLLEHHSNFEAALPGKPSSDEGPLLRSCVLLTYAAWEYYFEESLIEVAKGLSQHPMEILPRETKKFVASVRPTTQDSWVLAGDGWKMVLVRAIEVYARGIEKDPNSFGLNTVNSGVVKSAHLLLYGIDILTSVKWQRMSAARVEQKIDELVRLRGDIAHGKGPSGSLHLSHVRDWIAFAEKLVSHHDRLLFEWLEKQVNGLPA